MRATTRSSPVRDACASRAQERARCTSRRSRRLRRHTDQRLLDLTLPPASAMALTLRLPPAVEGEARGEGPGVSFRTAGRDGAGARAPPRSRRTPEDLLGARVAERAGSLRARRRDEELPRHRGRTHPVEHARARRRAARSRPHDHSPGAPRPGAPRRSAGRVSRARRAARTARASRWRWTSRVGDACP